MQVIWLEGQTAGIKLHRDGPHMNLKGERGAHLPAGIKNVMQYSKSTTQKIFATTVCLIHFEIPKLMLCSSHPFMKKKVILHRIALVLSLRWPVQILIKNVVFYRIWNFGALCKTSAKEGMWGALLLLRAIIQKRWETPGADGICFCLSLEIRNILVWIKPNVGKRGSKEASFFHTPLFVPPKACSPRRPCLVRVILSPTVVFERSLHSRLPCLIEYVLETGRWTGKRERIRNINFRIN